MNKKEITDLVNSQHDLGGASREELIKAIQKGDASNSELSDPINKILFRVGTEEDSYDGLSYINYAIAQLTEAKKIVKKVYQEA